jgi:hypothetical protein
MIYVIRVYKNDVFRGYDNDNCGTAKKLSMAYKWTSLADAKRWRTLLKRESPKCVFHIHKCELIDKGIV